MLSFGFLKWLKLGTCSTPWRPEAAVRGISGSNDSEHTKERWDLYRRRPQGDVVSGVRDKFMIVFVKSP